MQIRTTKTKKIRKISFVSIRW